MVMIGLRKYFTASLKKNLTSNKQTNRNNMRCVSNTALLIERKVDVLHTDFSGG
jgi:hypothetical protein